MELPRSDPPNPEQSKISEESDNYFNHDYDHYSVLERLNLNDNQQQLQDALAYYEYHFGQPMLEAPEKVAKSAAFSQISPEEMIEAFEILDIRYSEKRLHFLAQMYYSLPLPPFWSF